MDSIIPIFTFFKGENIYNDIKSDIIYTLNLSNYLSFLFTLNTNIKSTRRFGNENSF